MRRAARTDTNHSEIVGALRRLGFSVTDTSRIGEGFPDLVAGRRGYNLLIEIKDGNKPPSGRKLTPAQKDFHQLWRGTIHVVEGIGDVIRLANGTDK